MKMHSVALAGLTFATLLFSGCTNGDFVYTSGQQQNTLAKPHGGVESPVWVDWTKDARSQSAYVPGGMPRYGIGQP
jgi:hypothetical protein